MSMKGSLLPTEIIVTIDTHVHLDTVVVELRAAGMDVRQVLARPRIVIGAVDELAASKLSDIKGILAIEEEGTQREIAGCTGPSRSHG